MAMAYVGPGPTPMDANMTIAKTVSRTRAQVGDVLRYTIYFNNTGNAPAQKVWINDTIEVHTSYLSDSAASVGGTPNGAQRWIFTDVPAFSSRSFYLNVSVLYNATPGSLLRNRVTLDYLNSLGTKQPGIAAISPPTVFGIKIKSLHFHEDPLWAPGYDPSSTLAPTVNRNCDVPAQCDYDGDGRRGITIRRGQNFSDPSQFHDWIESPNMASYFHFQGITTFRLWVDDGGVGGLEQVAIYFLDTDWVNTTFITGPILSTRPLDAAPGFQYWEISVTIPDYTVSPNHTIIAALSVPTASAQDLQFAYESTSFDSGIVMETSTYIGIPFLATYDASGSPQNLFSYGERVDLLAGVQDPFGTFDIVNGLTWVNITNPTGSQVVSYQIMVNLGDYTTAVRLFTYSYNVPNPAIQGTYTVRVTSYESNGVFVYNQTTFDVRMPILQLSKTAPAQARAGSSYAYRIYYNNTGTSAAKALYVNDTFSAATSYVSDNASVAGTWVNGTRQWKFADVGPGSHFFDVTISVATTATAGSQLRNTVVFNYTDTKFQWLPGALRQANTTVLGPAMALVLVPLLNLVADTQDYVVRAYLNNTGNEMAPNVWLNFTYGNNGTYITDDATAQGYTYTRTTGAGFMRLYLRNITLGTHTLDVTFRLNAGLPGGAQEAVAGNLAYKNGGGYSIPSSSGQSTAYLNEPRMVLALTAKTTLAVPGTTVALLISFDNSGTGVGSAKATTLFLNFTVDWSFRNATGGGIYNAGANSVAWNLGQINPGTVGWLYANITLKTGVADQVVEHLTLKATFNDASDKARPATFSNASVVTQAPVMALAVANNDPQPYHGDLLTYTLYYNNTGTGTARNVWINGTLNPGTKYISTTAPGTVTFDTLTNTISIHIATLAPSNQYFTLVVQVQASLDDGAPLANTFTLDHQDANYNSRGRIQASSSGTLRSPVVTVTMTVDRTSAAPRDIVKYTLTVQNGGTAPAKDVWVNVTLSPFYEYLSDSAPVLATASGSSYSWHLTNFGPSKVVTFGFIVQLNASTPKDKIIPELATVDYSEAAAPAAMAQAKSEATTVTVSSPPPAQGLLGMDLLSTLLLLLGVLGAAMGAGAYFLTSRRAPIEEVFVVYRDGSLLAHRSKTLTPDKDEDVLAGMFTAVQQFINDSFSYGQARDLKHMNMGEYSVDIEKGQYIYLAVVHRGKANKALTARMVKAIGDLEAEFQPVLKDWGGNMEQVKGIKDRLRTLLRG